MSLCLYVFWSSAAALVIQQRWRRYRLKCGSARNRSARSNRDHGATSRAATLDQAATVIQVQLSQQVGTQGHHVLWMVPSDFVPESQCCDADTTHTQIEHQ